jgi:hypothetical protein
MKGALVVVVLILTGVLANILACGGPDKPPMVPDTTDPTMMSPEGGAAPTGPAK